MIQAASIFAKQILSLSGFRAGLIPGWVITILLPALAKAGDSVWEHA